MNKKGETEGLTDKNSDKLYAPKQLLPQSDYYAGYKEIFERHMVKYRKLLDGAKEGIMKKHSNKSSFLHLEMVSSLGACKLLAGLACFFYGLS